MILVGIPGAAKGAGWASARRNGKEIHRG